MQPLNTTLSLIVFFGPVRHPVCLDSKMQPPSLLLVLLGLTLTQGKQEILEKQGNGYGLDDTQHHPSTLHSEETQGYNDAPVSNTLKCPRFQYFDCMKCVPLRNGDNGPLRVRWMDILRLLQRMPTNIWPSSSSRKLRGRSAAMPE